MAFSYHTMSTCKLLDTAWQPYYKPVGQLVEIGEKFEIIHRSCTGFNIAESPYFMTAGHCITPHGDVVCYIDDSPWKSPVITGKCVINFGYDACDTGHSDTRMEPLRFVHRGEYSTITRVIDHGPCGAAGDYAILQLDPSSATHGALKLSPAPAKVGDEIFLIHHPEGHPKQFSSGKVTATGSDIKYDAHTMGGSSGAPVMSVKTGRVVGLHVRGLKPIQINEAEPMRQIIYQAKKKEARWAAPFYKAFGCDELRSSSIELKATARDVAEKKGCC